MVQITGKYKLKTTKNFDEYMKQLGVNVVLRKLGNLANPTIEFLENDDGSWTMKVITIFMSWDTHFRMGEPFKEKTPDGRHVTTTITLEEGNRLVQKQVADKVQKDTTVIRNFTEEGFDMDGLIQNDVVCSRSYRRLES